MSFDFDAFSSSLNEASQFRSHRIVCGDRTFFVNGAFLGEESPYFAKLFFGDFKEAETKVLTISPESNITEQDLIEFLCVLYGKKEVTVDNCVCLIRLGDTWDSPSVRMKCSIFLQSAYWSVTRAPDGSLLKQSIDILEVALIHGMRESVATLVQFIGRHTLEVLKKEGFVDRIKDTRVIAAVFALAATIRYWAPHEFGIFDKRANPCHCGQAAYYACATDGCVEGLCYSHRYDRPAHCRAHVGCIDESILYGDK